MRRKIPIVLSLIILMSSSGFILDKHFCNGNLDNIFLLPHQGKCCDSGMSREDGFCGDELVNLEVDAPFELLVSKINLLHLFQIAQLPNTLWQVGTKDYKAKIRKTVFSSLPVQQIKIYLRVESFLN